MTYGDFKDLHRRTAPAKILRDNTATNTKCSRNQHEIVSLVYRFFDKTFCHACKISAGTQKGIKIDSNSVFDEQ